MIPRSAADEAIRTTRTWIERAVISLNLCPFARAVYVKEQIRYVVSEARNTGELLAELERELRELVQVAADEVDTTLLIHPYVLTDFLDYNEFLGAADRAVRRLRLAGIVQIASFHPDYRFAGTSPEDVTNYTNRSPYPTLHLLREASVTRAVAAFPETSQIYERNMETLRRVGVADWPPLK